MRNNEMVVNGQVKVSSEGRGGGLTGLVTCGWLHARYPKLYCWEKWRGGW